MLVHTRLVVGLGFRGLVGREGELAELTAAVDDACAGKGSLVVLSGEAGIGKTRLCQELSTVASAGACRWRGGRAGSQRRCRRSGHGTALRTARRADARWCRSRVRLGVGGGPGRMFASMAQTWHRLERERPRLLVVDDVQWADQGTTRLLVHPAPMLRTMRVLLARSGASSSWKPPWRRRSTGRRRALRPCPSRVRRARKPRPLRLRPWRTTTMPGATPPREHAWRSPPASATPSDESRPSTQSSGVATTTPCPAEASAPTTPTGPSNGRSDQANVRPGGSPDRKGR